MSENRIYESQTKGMSVVTSAAKSKGMGRLCREVHSRRSFLHLTVREAAADAGLPTATFHRIERGQGDPRMSSVEKVQEWLRRTSFEAFQ